MIRSALLLLCVPLLGACGSKGSYELHWSVSCAKDASKVCAVTSAKDCADAGMDAVAVVAVRGDGRTRSLFPCFGPLGALGHGPGLDQGPVDLEITALSPGSETLAGPIGTQAAIPSTGVVPVEVTLPRPPACGDGVDNNGNGLVDMMDPVCQSPTDNAELP
jgi:hypothetical protein